MQLLFKNKNLERAMLAVCVVASALVVATFVMLFGFERPLLPATVLYNIQLVLLFIFIGEKIVRQFNAESIGAYWKGFWFQIPLFIALVITLVGAGRWFAKTHPDAVRHAAVGVYLVMQVIIKVCRTSVNLAATGRNPAQTLILSFLVLIVCGALVLMLPKSSTGEPISFVDSLFTATSATCVTGLIVKDTGSDFTLLGQTVILVLIQLGGLGIVVFGAVIALLLGQALSVRESVAMQDLLSTQTVSRIGQMVAFIFFMTILIEFVGALVMFNMWDEVPGAVSGDEQQWFCSIFHAISAFCNAGFSLFSESFIAYNRQWPIYAVVCPLIILGGLGFGVLYDLVSLVMQKVRRAFKLIFHRELRLYTLPSRRVQLQSKLVLAVSGILIMVGAVMIWLFERYSPAGHQPTHAGVLDALFQSITARTAGFNTLDIASMTATSKIMLIVLMFIGGSPGSTAGGIKTVTFAVIILAVIASLRKRRDVEAFGRSIRLVVVGRAITVTVLFFAVLFAAGFLLSFTERYGGFSLMDIFFETASALGTVGLTTGITPSLTTAGKLIIIVTMLIGRLGPLTLLAAMMFNLKPARYNYPEEVIVVG